MRCVAFAKNGKEKKERDDKWCTWLKRTTQEKKQRSGKQLLVLVNNAKYHRHLIKIKKRKLI